MPQREQCATCVHFHQFGSEPRGECHAHPPTVYAGGSRQWPPMRASEGCGEHKSGEPTLATKVNPETPGAAAKAARQSKR